MAYTTIDDPTQFFNTIIWSGDSSSPENFTVGFQPDLIWGKLRNTGYAPQWYDSVRTFGNDKDLQSSSTAAEGGGTADQYGYISGVTSTGFTATKGSDGGADAYGYWNESGRTYIAWNWKAGTSFTNDASSTGVGTIDSTGSASDTAGFSIVSYTGTGSNATIKHGLSTAPAMIIFKERDGTSSWITFHKDLTNSEYWLLLNTTAAQANGFSNFQNVAPTSSVFSVGTGQGTNGSSATYIAYCFAEKKGYSKFGSYTGNGQAGTSSPFVYLGFKPAFLIIKNTADTHGWSMTDNKRSGYNENSTFLYANANDTDAAYPMTSFYSNGFQPIEAGADKGAVNQTGNKYIYMAFAESPFVNSNGVPNNAR